MGTIHICQLIITVCFLGELQPLLVRGCDDEAADDDGTMANGFMKADLNVFPVIQGF